MISSTEQGSERTSSFNAGESGNATSTSSSCFKDSRNSSFALIAKAKLSLNPLSPLANRLAPARLARKAWLEQTLEVAFSFRMCCSRVERTMTKQSRPFISLPLPINRPGVCLISRLFFSLYLHPKSPRPGPPKDGFVARC